jgi:putative peptidoglycan lipid II flippase
MNWKASLRGAADEPSGTTGDSGQLASASRTLAFWTLVSRLTGFARVAALAAVFGPTFFGNLFQAALLIPYLLCEIMAGSLITAMLPPHLVHALERDGPNAAGRMARGFLGVILPVFATASLLVAALAPFLLSLLTAAVDDPSIRDRQIALGVPLLICLLPQVIFYTVTATGISVQHAHRRFALSTAAPVIENLGMILVLGLNAVLFGVGSEINEVTLPQVLLLGLGSSAAVGLHATVQWWGAYRLGVRLIPTAGWRDSAVRRIIRTAIPSCGSATLNSVGLLALLVASGDIPGGVIALQIGMNFFNLPIALCAFPIAFAQSPLLSRHYAREDLGNFSSTYRHSLRLTLFFALPACAVFLGMPDVLAAAVSFGKMGDASGISLVASVLAGLGFGIVGEAIFVVARSSAYARLDAIVTLKAMLIRVGIILIGIPLAMRAGGANVELWCLGLIYSLGVVAAATFLNWRGRGAMPDAGGGSLSWLTANAVVAALAALPASLIAAQLNFDAGSSVERILGAAMLLLMSGVFYIALQFLRRSDEVRLLLGLTRLTLPGRPDATPTV